MQYPDKQGKIMAKVSAFHSVYGDVYHECSKCTLGNNIEKRNRREGKGGKRRCDECKDRIDAYTC